MQTVVTSNKNLHADTGQFREARFDNADFEIPEAKAKNEKQKQELHQKETNDVDLKKTLPKLGYAVSVSGHLLAAFAQFSKILPDSITHGLGKLAPNITKLVNSINFFAKGLDAFTHNRALDSMARFLFPAIVPFMPVEDMYLGAGLGLGVTMMNDAHESRVTDKTNLGSNMKQSVTAFKDMLKESIDGGLGKDRKILLPKGKEKGHSMHTSGLGMFIGSGMGLLNKLLFKDEDSLMHKVLHKTSTIVRNIFGIWGDIIIMLHPDSNNNKAGIAYIAAATLDTLQAVVLPKELREGVSHIVQSIANIANYFYANTTQARSEGNFQDYA